MTIEARIAAYLDSELDRDDALAVEAALLDPKVAQLLGEELMLRQLLATMPPEGVSEAFLARLEAAVGVAPANLVAQLRGQLGSVWEASGWAARGATSGLSTLRYAWNSAAERPAPTQSARRNKTLWRRAASYLWRRRR